MPVTRYYQALNALEKWTHDHVSNDFAINVRESVFDRLEDKIIHSIDNNYISRVAWNFGSYLFPALGLMAEILLTILGEQNTISTQYANSASRIRINQLSDFKRIKIETVSNRRTYTRLQSMRQNLYNIVIKSCEKLYYV